MGKNYSDNLHSNKNTGQNLTEKQMFEISEKLMLEQPDENFVECLKSAGKFFIEKVISGQRCRSHQSLACKGLRIFRFCAMSWKGKSEPSIKYCLGTTVGMVQRFITIQNTGHNRRRTDGIRVEYFPRIHYIAARPRKWATQNDSKDELFSFRCSMTSYGEIKTMSRNVLLMPHLCLTIETVFRTIVSVNQLSIYGAVPVLCEEYSICQTSTGRLVVAKQSNPLFAPANLLIMTLGLSIEILALENPLQKHKEQVEKLPQPDQLLKNLYWCRILENSWSWTYFMTKHTNELLQIAEPVECREYTVPRDDKSIDPRGWIQGNTKIGPVLEVTTSYLQGEHGVEIRIESVNKDNSHSWVRISHGLNKLVTDLIDREYDDNEQQTSTTKTEVFAFASRSKAKAKPRRPSTICSSSRTFPILERTWIDIEPGAQFDQAYPVAKRINTLLRHGELLR